ncbi:MAG: Asp23/Gls24 family envelope stress response protein [Oscillospiraceae bacterium]|nr:Asp23/Gls24 family envelope stress response protein [Oscillospiraceae bacterium]MBR7149660.1 Asp23/Gls24 family envelope stress response protein [Oscillospiraceae bacterium]
MADNREYLTHTEQDDSISISDDVLVAIASKAVSEVEGVGSLMNQTMTEQLTEQIMRKKIGRGVRVESMDGEIVLNVYIMVRYGYAIPEVAEKVQQAVAAAVAAMTNFKVSAVNVHVGGVSFD